MSRFKRLYLLSAVLLIVALCACLFVACHDNKSKISVTLDYNDGSGKTEVVELSVDQALPTPTLDGHSFDGWTVDEQGQMPATTLTDGMTVYAQWTKQSYVVDFYVNNLLVQTYAVAYGESAYAPDLQFFADRIPNNLVFDGWDKDFGNITGPLTVNAILKPANARVRFMSEVGDDRYEVATYKGLIGKPVYTPYENPTRRGFVFDGWYKADGTVYSDTDVFEAETTYYAHWSINAPTMPTVSGLKTFTYGSALNLVSGDARSYLGITYDYGWQLYGEVLSDNKTLNMERIESGTYTFTLRITAHSSINGVEESINNSFDVPVTVNKAKLIASVAPITISFADQNGISKHIQVAYSGFKFDDDESAITSVGLLDTDYERFSSPSREYYFTLSFNSKNYEVVDENSLTPSSTVTVLKNTLRLSNKVISKVYDGNILTETFGTWAAVYSDLRAIVRVATTSANVGEYTLGNGLIVTEMKMLYGHYNQDVSYGFDLDLSVSAQITPATLNYVKPAPVIYDGAPHSASIADIANTTISYSTDGTNYTFEAPSFINADTYTVYVNIQKENYTPVSEQFDFVINKANVQVIFDNINVALGADIPQYNYKIVGLSSDFVTVNPVCGYTPSSEAGEYQITCDIQNTDNISFTVTNGKLTVLDEGETVKPTLIINLDGNFEITYGDAIPSYTVASVVGLIDGDEFENVVSGSLSVTCDYSAVGIYPLTITGLTSDKYEIVTDNSLIVKKATLNISVSEHTPIVYGSPVPTDLTFTADGFKFDDGISLLDGISVETTYTQRASASQKYDVYINLNGLSLENYDIVTTSAQLTVNKAQAQIQTFDGNLCLNYTGDVYDFKAELNPQSTNTDENASIALDIPYGQAGGIYNITLTSPETENYLQATATATVCILSAKIGHALYTLEDALEIGGNILLIGNTFLSRNAQIKQGTTLTLPCREDGKLYAYADIEYGTANRYINPLTESLLYILTIRDGVTLTVNGTLAVGGEIGQHGGAYQGHTTGMHSVVLCEDNAQIIVNNGGLLDCIGGFVLGGGSLTVNDGGTLKHNFAVLYFRGGTSTVGSFQQGRISPFNVFDMPNVQVAQRINYGATVIAYCDLYASGSHNTAEVTVVAKDQALFNLSENSYLNVKHNGAYDTAPPQLAVTTIGDVRIGSLKLTINFIFSVTVDMAEVICPLSYIINLSIKSGTLTVSNRFKLLPGANINIENDGELILMNGGGLISYTDDWKDTTFVDSDGNQIPGSSMPESNTWYPHDKSDAHFTVAGKLTVQDGAFIAGNIYARNGAIIEISGGADISATSIEGVAVVGANGSGQVWHKTAVITKSAIGINEDGSTVELKSNHTYNYINGSFV